MYYFHYTFTIIHTYYTSHSGNIYILLLHSKITLSFFAALHGRPAALGPLCPIQKVPCPPVQRLILLHFFGDLPCSPLQRYLCFTPSMRGLPCSTVGSFYFVSCSEFYLLHWSELYLTLLLLAVPYFNVPYLTPLSCTRTSLEGCELYTLHCYELYLTLLPWSLPYPISLCCCYLAAVRLICRLLGQH